ncbi:MAG TPA: hypothetical protein VJS20_08670, partial [Gemmatimonadales bacterium]|nr:hypothetical protein [Gemmatimonadales bacterium]
DSGTGTRKNRIWSVSIGLSGGIPTLTPSPILFPGQPSRVENVRDMVVVRTPYSVPQKAYLYATLAYTGILEYDISAGTSATYAVPCGFPERIDAASDGTNILLAMGLGTEGPAANDSTTGVRGTGLWRDTCLSVGVGDPDDPGVSCISGQVSTRTDYYVKVPSTPPALRLTKVSAASLWNGLRLVQRSSVNFWAYANSVGAGTVVDIVSFPDGLQTNPPPPQLVIPVVNERFRYKDYGFVAFTCVASEINPELVSVGGDGGGAVLGAGSGLLFLGKTSVPDLPGIAGTELCPGATPDSTECLRAPGLFGVWNGPSAHWIDPADPTREWFVRGFITREPCGANVCDDPCAGGIERRWQEAPVPAEHSKVGWLMTNIEPTAAGSGMPSSATVMDAKGWQYAPKPAPSLPGRAGVNPPLLSEDDALPDPKPGESAAETSISNYVFTAIDPRRNEAGHPLLLSMTRARSAFGLKLFRPSQMTDVDSQACAAGPEKLDPLLEKTAPAGDGIGEHHVLTHLELDTVTCNPGGVCPVAGSPAQEFSNQGATFFEVRDSLGVSHWVVGVSAGYNVIPASEAACPWATYSAQAMAVLYDVTQTGDAFLPPRLLRVALATPETGEPDDPHLRSLSWGPMAVKSYGEGPAARTIAFLGDAMGRVLAFDVSYDQLYPEATTPYLVSPTQVNPVIFPMKSKVLPYDPYDGQHANVVRVIEHEDMLYVAAGRDGIAILDVANPADAAFLEFVDVLDTPGMAMEVLVRRIEDPAPPESQLLECDAGGGIRVYH